jgi:hypothetical protein
MIHAPKWTRAATLSALLLAAACSGGEDVGVDGDVVGGPCAAADDCADGSTCITSGDFPGGQCSVACSSDAQCPDGTRCISNKSGVCLLSCASAADCRGDYKCEDESLESGDGSVLVCSGT